MLKRLLNQSGDTIIEVLLSLSIIAMVLGVSYALSTRSLRTGRQAQERIEALKEVESQIEKLKYVTSQPGFAWGNGPYCINSTTAPYVSANIASFNATDINLDGGTDFATYAAAGCQTQGGRYNLSIQYNSASNDTFTVMARWNRLGGGRDEAKIFYRLHR